MNFFHKLSRMQTDENHGLTAETVGDRNMLEKSDSSNLSRLISDVPWFAFINMLECNIEMSQREAMHQLSRDLIEDITIMA